MFNLFVPDAFFILLAVSVISAFVLVLPQVSLHYVRIHIGVITLPPLAALIGLITSRENRLFGPWHIDSLSWLVALFVLTIGLIVQRYSVHYLLGDQVYRKYFSLLTLTTVADSIAWLSNDLRFLLICWGATLLSLTLIIRLNQKWHVAKNAANLAGRMFSLSWLVLLAAFIWLNHSTGSWELSQILSRKTLAELGAMERTSINLLLILSVIIPAAQWPFHRWLLDSVVAPTPVSAVMHAGIVNAGGIILTRFSPLFSGSAAQIILLVLSSISVLIGTGIMLVHVDYKRQLVGSTIAQMGFMLIQCALGAYLAAIIHAVLHGLFKSTLFLQAGSAIQQKELKPQKAEPSSLGWKIAGGVLGAGIAIGFWLASSKEGYQLVSALILGWSVSLAWSQLVASVHRKMGRIAGLILFLGAAFVYGIIHTVFNGLLEGTVVEGAGQSPAAAVVLIVILLAGTAAGAWLARNRSSAAFAIIYLWLVRLGEPHRDLVDTHPKYLAKNVS